MCTLKEIWNFILDYKTSSAITFLSLLFAVFVWLLTIRRGRRNDEKGAKWHREVLESLDEIKKQIIPANLKEQVGTTKEKLRLISTKMYYDGSLNSILNEEMIEDAAKTYLMLKNIGIIKEELTEILFILMIAVMSKPSILNLAPISINTDGIISGSAVFTSTREDVNERMNLFAKLIKEIEQSPRDIARIEVTDKFLNIIIFKDCKLKFPQLQVHITDKQCKQYFQKWYDQL